MHIGEQLAVRLDSKEDALPGDRALLIEAARFMMTQAHRLDALHQMMGMVCARDRSADVSVHAIEVIEDVRHLAQHHEPQGPCFAALLESCTELELAIGRKELAALMPDDPERHRLN